MPWYWGNRKVKDYEIKTVDIAVILADARHKGFNNRFHVHSEG
jgi:hypothetical protein